MQQKKKVPISVFIIAKNEGDRIGKAIHSVIDWVDEVLVIDSGSDDDTVIVAKELGARVIFNSWQGYGQQKRFGEEQCRNNWILNLDADERASPEVKEEIITLFTDCPIKNGYRIRIVDVMPIESSPRKWAWAVTQIRLYNRQHGRFRNHSTHDAVVMDEAEISSLTKPLYHQSVRSFEHLVDKANFYTTMQAEDLYIKSRKIHVLRLLMEFPITFIKAYVLRRYFIYGSYGIGFSMIFAFSKFLRLAKLREKQLLAEREANKLL